LRNEDNGATIKANIQYTVTPAYTGLPGIYIITPNIPSTSVGAGYLKKYVYGIMNVK
jgi:hypothetical protein